MDKYKQSILDMRENYWSYAEISKRLGISRGYARALSKRYGVGYSGSEVLDAQNKSRDKQRTDASEYVSRYRPHLEYVSGYENIDSKLCVKCKTCGTKFEICGSSVRNPRLKCECQTCRQQRRIDEKQAEKYRQQLIKASQKIKGIQVRFNFVRCQECGMLFERKSKADKYCSVVCRNRKLDRQKRIIRDKRINESNEVDKDITLKKLYARDGGRCYICGCQCDFNDSYWYRGAHYTGKSYPTIEHVRPLCKGGMHSWDNVKLACFECNTKKGVKYHA